MIKKVAAAYFAAATFSVRQLEICYLLLSKVCMIQAIPLMIANNIIPPTASLNKAPTNSPIKLEIAIITNDAIVLPISSTSVKF